MSHLTLEKTGFKGLLGILTEIHEDERGGFYRVFCSNDLDEMTPPFVPVQSSISTNRAKGTLRGMHFQIPPHQERKIVRCVAGAVYDIAIDLRPEEPTYGKWFGMELSAENGKALLIPSGFAHGFCTLSDDTSVLYTMDAAFVPEAARGVRWNDPGFAIDWPCRNPILNPRDAAWPDYEF